MNMTQFEQNMICRAVIALEQIADSLQKISATINESKRK